MVTPFAVDIETSGPYAGIVTVRMEDPAKPVLVLDHQLIQRLEVTLLAVPVPSAGLILATTSDRVFVAGADLKTISEWDDSQLTRYLEYGAKVFAMLADFPFPTAAAINGAALGGGLELAMHCDALVGAPSPTGKPYPIGLPEAGLSLCPGWGGTNLLPARIDAADAISRTAGGRTMLFDEAVKAGLFDKVASSAGELLNTAKSAVAELRTRPSQRDGAPKRWIGRPDRAAPVLKALDSIKSELPQTDSARAVTEAIDAGLTRGWQAALEVERRHLVRLRHTPAARQALEAFFAKASAKK